MRPENCEACEMWCDDDAPCHHLTPRKPHIRKRPHYKKPWFVSDGTYTTSGTTSLYTLPDAMAYARGWTPLGGCR